MAAVIVAASGMLETTGLPLSAAVDGAALNFGTVQSEREKLRRKMTGVLVWRFTSARRSCGESNMRTSNRHTSDLRGPLVTADAGPVDISNDESFVW
jgi:hypothetical protein